MVFAPVKVIMHSENSNIIVSVKFWTSSRAKEQCFCGAQVT